MRRVPSQLSDVSGGGKSDHSLILDDGGSEHGSGGGGSTVTGSSTNAGGRIRHELNHWNFPFKSWAASEGLAMPVTVKKISAGNAHTLLLTTGGEVWSFGGGERGQLGHGTDQTSCVNPVFVRTLYGHHVVDVAAGGWHSVFVDEVGHVYACGDNRSGQLGLGHRDTMALPTRSTVITAPFPGSGPDDVAMKATAAGQFHTLLLSKGGCVWSCGANRNGQLGVLFRTADDEATPRPLLAFTSIKPKTIACGTNHSIVVTEGGDLWTWGRGDAGQLGHGDRKDLWEPKLVRDVTDVWIISADGGDYHTIACADNGGTCRGHGQWLPLSHAGI